MELIYNNKKTEDEILKAACDIKEQEGKIAWTDDNILIQGDNFKALSKLLAAYEGKVDLVYIDPPFNTNLDFYVADGRANTISSSSLGEIAYSDKMSKDEFLEFIRERLIVIRRLLSDEGSIYLHIDYKIGHYIKVIMDEVFGEDNFKNDIGRIKTNPKNFNRKAYGNEKDLILFYSKNSKKNIWNDIRVPLSEEELEKAFSKVEADGRRYTTVPLHAPGETKGGATGQSWRGIPVPAGRHWRTNPKEFDILDAEGRIEWSSKGNPRIKKYADEHQGKKIQDVWKYKDPQYPIYPTEKNAEMIERIIEQSSREDSIVMDCFAGSGATLRVAQRLGRRWIGVDCSEISINIIKDNIEADYLFINVDSE